MTTLSNSTLRTFHAQGVSKVPVKYELVAPSFIKTRPLSDTRKKNLENILQREAEREKKSKLQTVLTIKLVKKYGREYSKVIGSEVSSFLNSHDQISSEDLKALEKQVDEVVKHGLQLKSQNVHPSSLPITPVNVEPVTESPRLPTPPKGKEWQVLQAYQAIVGEDRIRKEQEDRRQRKIIYKKNLDEHMSLLNQQKQLTNVDDITYYKHIEEDVIKFREEEKQKTASTKNKHLEERSIREAQIEELKRIRQAEKDEIKRQEEQNIRFALEQIEREKQSQLQAKRIERERQEKIARENLENLEKRAQRKLEEAAEDHRLMQEYAAKLDREAFERDTAFQRRIANLEAFAKKYHHEGAGKKEREDELKFETLLLREVKRKEEADLLDEKKRLENKKMKELLASKENERLLEKKRLEKEENRKRDELLAIQYRQDAEEYKRQMELEKQKRLAQQSTYRNVLNQHMSIRRHEDVNLEGMAEKELKINLPELRKIMSDKPTYSRILGKIGLADKRNSNKLN